MKNLIIALSVLSGASVANADLLVNCPRLLDGTSETVHTNKTVRISNNKITGIADAPVEPGETDTVINLEDATCMPGLIDAHVHITSQQSPHRYRERFALDPAEKALRAVPYAERTLMAGFTTVRDLGSSHNLSINLRNAINDGHIPGPRILTAGKSLATTGGHADPSNGVNQKYREDPGPRQGVVNSPEDAKKAVRQRYKDRADLIKITATGGVLSEATSGQNPQFTDEELDAIISIARDYEFKVAAHAHGNTGMKRAVAAGVDSIEHGTHMGRDTMKLMKKMGTAYVPTIMAGKFVAEKAEVDGYFSETVRPKARAIGPLIQATFAKAYAEGVHIVFGTDTGVSAHGDNWKEFIYMVEAGMPPIEALNSAMKPGAVLLGIDDELGTLETGKLADMIAVRGNPVEDISLIEHIELVIKDGKIYQD
jgi:imidazolonepropionase-like amidohydrolase